MAKKVPGTWRAWTVQISVYFQTIMNFITLSNNYNCFGKISLSGRIRVIGSNLESWPNPHQLLLFNPTCDPLKPTILSSTLYCLLLRISFFFYFFRKCCILAYEMEWRSIFLLQGLQCDIFYCCAALPILCFVLRMVLACYFCGAWREFTIGPAIKMSICFSTSWDFWILGVLWWNKFLDPGSFCGMNLLHIISFRKRDPGSFG